MDQRFDPFIRNLPRHAETADSWMGIRRHEQDKPPKKDDRHKKNGDDPVWEDVTAVSLEALRLFLEGLVTAQQAPVSSAPVTPHTPAGDAAHAYQATASRYHHTPPPPSSSPDAPALNTDEQRMIHQILESLARLQERGLETLVIVKGGTFLESVRESVRQALA